MSKPSYRLIEAAAPAEEPVTLAEAKAHLRIGHDAEDGLIESLITAARQVCESFTGRALVTRTYALYLDRWPATGDSQWWDGAREGADILNDAAALNLPHPPLREISEINTYDAAGQASVYAASNYFIDTAGNRVVLTGAAPVAARQANGIEINFSAGYGGAEDVPSVFKQAIRQMVAHLYERRGDGGADVLGASGARGLLQPFRAMELP